MYRGPVMTFKPAEKEDAQAIWAIIQDAQAYLKGQGIDQWQNNYPNMETINDDINNKYSYVLSNENEILGTIVVIFADDITYHSIYEGEWLTSGSYAVMHRLAINPEHHGLGLASEVMKHAESMCVKKGFPSVRVDTHKENKAMQKVLVNNGFVYCGIIYLVDGNERMAFEKVLNEIVKD